MGSPLRRVCVLGCAGAGKTYVARQLARLAGLPYVDLDRLFWQPGWRVPEEAAWRAVQRGRVAGSEWVLDGDYASTYDERLPLADTVVVLETPRWRCLARVLVRRVRRRGVEVAPGCPDKLDAGFLAYGSGSSRTRITVKRPDASVRLPLPPAFRRDLGPRGVGSGDALRTEVSC